MVFKYYRTITALFFQRQQTYLLGMYLCALHHTKVPLEMLSLRHQGLSAEESHFQFLQLNLNNDSRVIKCSLSFSTHCHFPLRAAWLKRYFHCPHTNTTPTGFALLEEVRSLWPSRTTLAGESQYSGKETRKANKSSASKKGQRKQGKGTQTQPCPERFVQKLQRNCSPEVLYQVLSDFFLSCILQSVLWGASKAQISDSVI